MEYYKRALSVIKSGAPLMKITALPVKDEIVRLKSSVPNDKLELLNDTEKHLDEQMGNLERIYRKVGI